MYDLIFNTLIRQERALTLLSSLLDEELSLLMEQDTSGIVSLELSIHELVRQLVREKTSVITMLGGGRLRDYMAMRTEEERVELDELVEAIDAGEQQCSRKASQNAELSVALLDQGDKLLTFLHKQIQPKAPPAYGRKGQYNKYPRGGASLISGSM